MKIISSAKRLFSGLLLLVPAAAYADNHEFSIVVLPDTQLYAETYPAIIEAQMQWIVDNQAAENIIYVAQLGDLKDDLFCNNKQIASSTGGSRTEWQIVDQAFGLLETATSAAQPDGIPFGTVAGNHDFEPVGGACPTDWDDPAQRILDNATTGLAYNNLFGPARFAGRAYYGGSRIGGSNEDNFTLFESNGVKFIAINLGYREGQNLPLPGGGEASPEQAWADNLLQTYSDRLGIITSHYFMRCNIVTGAPGASSCNSTGSLNSIGSYGAQVYARLQNNPNLFMMLGAHKRGEAYRLETRSGMQPVHVMLANYQSMLYPGGDPTQASTFQNLQPAPGGYGNSGFMRIMRFDVDSGTVDIEAFSPPVPETPAVAGSITVANCQNTAYSGGTCSTPAISARSYLPSVFTPANPGANNVLHTGTASNMTGIDFTGYADDTIPNPVLSFEGTEDYVDAFGNDFTRYNLNVDNWAEFPDDLFASAPSLPPCGSNTSASRSWVDIYDGTTDQRIFGFCALGQASSLQNIWFGRPLGTTPPSLVYIEINDRETGTIYTSNTISIP